VTGYPADEIIHHPNPLELLYPDPEYLTRMQTQWANHGNDFRDWEWEITCKDGTRKTILWANVSAEFPIPGWAGWAVGIDISDRKRIETALQESEARYRRIVETAGEGIWVIDVENQTSFVNERMAQLLGTTSSAMLGRTVFDFMDEEGKCLAEVFLTRRRQGIEEQHDFKFKRLDGSDLWAIVETTPILDADGRYQGALAMVTDITDRKGIEDQLLNLSDRLSLAIQSGAIGIWEWDLVRDVSVWDERMCELFGISPAEFTGTTQTWLKLMHPEDRASALASTDQALRGEKDFDTRL
jgi:PAS domain S-box-containing protein